MKELNKKLCLLLLLCTLIIPSSFVNAEEGENNSGSDPTTSEETPTPSPSPSPSSTPSTGTEENTETKSNDTTLKSLKVNGKAIELKSDKREYELVVKSDVDTAKIEAIVNDSKARIDNDKSDIGSNDLKVGTTTFKIVVIPESGENNAKTYQIKITRATDNLNLTKLNIQGLKLNEAFDLDTTEYTADVTYNVTSITIQNGHPNGTTVSVNGNSNLKVGKNTVTVTVKNTAGESKVYTIIVTRGTEEELLGNNSSSEEVFSEETTSTVASVDTIAKNEDGSNKDFSLRSVIIVTSSVLLLLIASLGIYFYVRSGDSDKRKEKKIAKLKKKQAKIEEQLTGLMPIITEEQEEEYLHNKNSKDEDEVVVEEDAEEPVEYEEENDFEDTIELNPEEVKKSKFEYEEFDSYSDDDDEEEIEIKPHRRRVDRSILDDELDDLFDEDGDE